MWDLTNNSLSRHQKHTVPRCLFHLYNVNSLVCHFHTHTPQIFTSSSIWHFHSFTRVWIKTCWYWQKEIGNESMTGASSVRPGGGGAQQRANCFSLLAITFFIHFMGPRVSLIFRGGMKIYKITQSENSFSVRFLQLLETRDELCLYTRNPF